MSDIATVQAPAATGYTPTALEEGLTPRTFWVIFYGAFILMPANIYLLLVAGTSLSGAVAYVALILWVEMARLGRKPLTAAEAFIVYSISGMAAGQLLFYNYAVHPAYFRVSEIAHTFKDANGVPFADLAPSWWAPPAEVAIQRTFLHSAWVAPIAVSMAVWVFHIVADLSLGIIGREMFIKVEKLDFPFARPTATACKTLTENKEETRRPFSIAAVIGSIWGAIVYFPVLLGSKIVDWPIPWADFNTVAHQFVPGAVVGVATDIMTFAGGLVLRLRVIVSMLLGGIAIQIVGNAWAAQYHPIFSERFAEGMSIRTTLMQQLFVWMSVFIGGMLAAALLPIITQPRMLFQTFANLGKSSRALQQSGASESERTVPIKWLLFLFFGSIIFAVLLFRILIPDFPWYFIAPFAILWSFVFSMIDIRAKGDTGFRVDPPYVREGLIIGTNSVVKAETGQGLSPGVWYAPWPISLGSAQWVEDFKTCELTNCRPRSYVKAAILGMLVGMAANLFFMSVFWSVAPIPSSTYPYAATILPVWSTQLCFWMSTTIEGARFGDTSGAEIISQVFRFDWMVYSFLIFTAIFALGKWFKKYELSLIALAVGMAVPLPFTISLFMGGLVAHGIKRWKGEEWFESHRYVIVAGLGMGMGVVLGMFASIAALTNSLVSLPY
ncbi:MAG TPA: OPT/YSL family transporter [Planctomycetota bacterium]|nr:OPT/YSL family transporter [Planctomycetota bacterium]